MIVRNSRYKEVLPDTIAYKGQTYTKAYAKGKLLFANTDDDYEYQYFTVESLEDGNVITFTIPAALTTSDMTSVSYSTDNGSTWNITTIDGTAKTITVNLDAGDKVFWKGSGSRMNNTSVRCTLNCSKQWEAYGNIMSLLYGDNFYGQTSLTSRATFNAFFYTNTNNDGNLINTENLVLPATTLSRECYASMFRHNYNLVKGPKLPATNLGMGCYTQMFYGCWALIEAPELPAQTLTQTCYRSMFYKCTSLTEAPELPATTLATQCYQYMFTGCSSLTEAPELPATTLATQCYQYMFQDCTSLNYIKCLATDISATNCTATWVQNVAPTGTFVKADGMNDWVIDSVNGIPIGWTLHNYENCTVTLSVNNPSYGSTTGAGTYHTGDMVTIKANAADGYRFVGWYDGSTLVSQNEGYTFEIWTNVSYQAVFEVGQVDYSTQYFTIESLEDGNVFFINARNYYDGSKTVYVKKNDAATWSVFSTNSSGMRLNIGDKVYIKCTTTSWNAKLQPSCTKKYKVYGNIMSLIYGDNFQNKTTLEAEPTFKELFIDEKKLVDASNLVLPATSVPTQGYQGMFQNCTILEHVPSLPATTVGNYGYAWMFDGCIALTEVPVLPATTLGWDCYYRMFRNCYYLAAAPSLPATKLWSSSYEEMFYGCYNLSGELSLPATQLSANVYKKMLTGAKVSSIKIYAPSSSYEIDFGSLTSGIHGTYYVKPNATSNILNACPTGWTISKTL